MSSVFCDITPHIRWKSTNVSEEPPPSSGAKNKPSVTVSFLEDFLLYLFFGPDDGGDSSSETSVTFELATRHYIPEESALHNNRSIAEK
jgi:hypothetical protein